MKQKVLFLCTGNSCRSQMAEGWLRHLAGDRFEAKSAGTHPVGLNPMTATAMQEIGVDVRHQRSKHVDEFKGQFFAYVITVCDRAKESCPVFPGAVNVRHWCFDDPAALPPPGRLEAFRRVRDEIRDRLCQFLAEEGKPILLFCALICVG